MHGSGFGQVLKSDPLLLHRTCLRPSVDEAPRRTREKASGIQGKIRPVPHQSSLSLQRYKNALLT